MSAPLDHFRYDELGLLGAEGVSLGEVADLLGTPAYVYSAEAIRAPLRELQKGLQGIDALICFAVKANSNIHILKLLADAGAGMDLVSGGELVRAIHAGVTGNRIVFSGVGKTPGEMAQAIEAGIFSFNVESVSELELLNEVAGHAGERVRVSLRFNPDVDAKTHPYISTGLRKNKFGLERAEVLAIARSHAKYPHLRLAGVSIHIGSQILGLKPLEDSFVRMKALIAELDKILPEKIEVADLGGGLGIRYDQEKPATIAAYCKLIQKHFGPKARGPRPARVVLEPGRILVGNAGVLLTEVLYRKARSKKDFLVVDAAMNDLMRPSLYGSFHDIVPIEKRLGGGTKSKADIVGPVCETSDCFASDRMLSPKIQPGDLLAILSAGAYGFSMSSNYNTRPRPPEVLIEDGSVRIIRRRETYDDLIGPEEL